MEEALAKIGQSLGVAISTVFNPFLRLPTIWRAAGWHATAMTGDFIQVNGDNVFRSDLVEKLLAAPVVPVGVATNLKQAYDSDDMKVILDRGRLTEIGKTLPVDTVDAEAIGFYVFRGAGSRAYVETLERAMRDPQALSNGFPRPSDRLQKELKSARSRSTGCSGARWIFQLICSRRGNWLPVGFNPALQILPRLIQDQRACPHQWRLRRRA